MNDKTYLIGEPVQPTGYSPPPPYTPHYSGDHPESAAYAQPDLSSLPPEHALPVNYTRPAGNDPGQIPTIDRLPPEEYVQDTMILSVISVFFCCLLGLLAVIKSSESKDDVGRRDFDKARNSASTTRKLAISAIVTGLVLAGVTLVFGILLPLHLIV